MESACAVVRHHTINQKQPFKSSPTNCRTPESGSVLMATFLTASQDRSVLPMGTDFCSGVTNQQAALVSWILSYLYSSSEFLLQNIIMVERRRNAFENLTRIFFRGLISYCWYNPQPMRKDHSITGTTILQTTLEDADSTQFYWWYDKSGDKGSKLYDVSVFNTIVS